MVAKFNSKTHYKKCFPLFPAVLSAFAFKVCKKCKYDQKIFFFLKKMQNGYQKNVEFDIDFESFEKVSKTLVEKVINEKVTKN
jgi:hypothetical protein